MSGMFAKNDSVLFNFIKVSSLNIYLSREKLDWFKKCRENNSWVFFWEFV